MRFNSFVSLFLVSTLLSLVGCGDSSSGGKSGALPTLEAGKVSANGCLNIEAVNNLLSQGTVGAVKFTSDFKPDSRFSTRKAIFHTQSAFDLKDMATNSIFPIVGPVQTGCETVQAKTLSGEPLNFKVVASSPNSLKISLQRPQDETLTDYQLEALEDKMQAKEYEFTVVSPTHLQVVSTYKTFDAHCKGDKTYTNTIQEEFFWGFNTPNEFMISDSFYQQVIAATDMNGTVETPVIPAPEAGTEVPAPGTEVPPVDGGATPTPVDPTVPPPQATPAPAPADPANPTPAPVEDPTNPGGPTTPVPAQPAAPAGIFPAVFRLTQATDMPAGYVKISADEIRNILSKPIKAEYMRCGF